MLAPSGKVDRAANFVARRSPTEEAVDTAAEEEVGPELVADIERLQLMAGPRTVVVGLEVEVDSVGPYSASDGRPAEAIVEVGLGKLDLDRYYDLCSTS